MPNYCEHTPLAGKLSAGHIPYEINVVNNLNLCPINKTFQTLIISENAISVHPGPKAAEIFSQFSSRQLAMLRNKFDIK